MHLISVICIQVGKGKGKWVYIALFLQYLALEALFATHIHTCATCKRMVNKGMIHTEPTDWRYAVVKIFGEFFTFQIWTQEQQQRSSLGGQASSIQLLCLYQARLPGGGIMFSMCPFVRPSVRPSVCYRSCEHDILKTNEPIMMPVNTGPQGKDTGPQGKGMKRSILGLGCQRSRSHEATDRFGGLRRVFYFFSTRFSQILRQQLVELASKNFMSTVCQLRPQRVVRGDGNFLYFCTNSVLI